MKNKKEMKFLIIFTVIAISGALMPILLPIINGAQELTPIHIVSSITIGILVTTFAYKNRKTISKVDHSTDGNYSGVIKTLVFGKETQVKKNLSKRNQKK